MGDNLHNVLDFPLSMGRKLLVSVPVASPPAAQESIKRSNSSLKKGTLDYDLGVILAIFLCAFIIAVCLKVLHRCLLCCRRQPVHGSISDDAVLSNTGLKKAAMKALPIIIYTAASNPEPVPTDCPICLAEFAEGEKVKVLPKCSHGFHSKCIDKWFVAHSSCPMCRFSLNLQSGNKKPGGAAIV